MIGCWNGGYKVLHRMPPAGGQLTMVLRVRYGMYLCMRAAYTAGPGRCRYYSRRAGRGVLVGWGAHVRTFWQLGYSQDPTVSGVRHLVATYVFYV